MAATIRHFKKRVRPTEKQTNRSIANKILQAKTIQL